MIPITLVNKAPVKERSVPTEESLQQLLALGPEQYELVQQLIDTHKLQFRIENGKLLGSLQGTELWLKKFITDDPSMLELKREIRLTAKFDDEVLITGETGTGKELLAHALIGDRETRVENPGIFVAVNCAGLPEELIESELFGHVQGAFTGAVKDKQGMLAYAKGGVFFLDEIADLPLPAQGKLLRVLQERVVRRVGANKDEPITCKVVCGTKKDIVKMTDQGTFRDDLFARISTLHFHVKPLRERPADIEPIIKSMRRGEAFLQWAKDTNKLPLDTKLNVRSLQQHVRRWVVLGRI